MSPIVRILAVISTFFASYILMQRWLARHENEMGDKSADEHRYRSIAQSADSADTGNWSYSSGADSPPKLPKSSWKQALKEVKGALGDKNLPMLAAGIAFFSTLAFFPLLAAAVAVAAFIISPQQVTDVATAVEAYMPRDVASLINTQLANLSGQDTSNILIALLAIVISLYSASSATQNLIKATNETYDIDESRSFIKLKLISFALTVGGLLLLFILIPLLLVSGDFLQSIGVPSPLAETFPYVRWLLVLAVISVALAAFYRYGPDRRDSQWQWVSWGAAAATLIWLIGTALFFFYAQNFASFSESYGVFAGIIILMTWLNLSAFIFLLGAEVNHRLEEQSPVPTEDS